MRSYTINYPIYGGATYDASTTNLTYTLPLHDRELEIVLSFLSPITPTSTLRQSLPASYVNVYVTGNVDVNVLRSSFDVIYPVNAAWNAKRFEFPSPKSQVPSPFPKLVG